jgi:hypothetical protein
LSIIKSLGSPPRDAGEEVLVVLGGFAEAVEMAAAPEGMMS